MHTEYAWFDGRWQDSRWLEVFRIRLCGWLPADLATDAIARGLLLQNGTSDKFTVELTEDSHRLTDIGKVVDGSSHNCVLLATALVAKGFDPSWLAPEKNAPAYFLVDHQLFPKRFRDAILKEISKLDVS